MTLDLLILYVEIFLFADMILKISSPLGGCEKIACEFGEVGSKCNKLIPRLFGMNELHVLYGICTPRKEKKSYLGNV